MNDIFVAQKKDATLKDENTVPSLESHDHMNVLTSFCQNPTGISFQNQRPKETIILFLRAHFITNIAWLLLTIFLLILPLIILIFLPTLGINFLSSEDFNRFTIVYVLFYYLIVFSYVFISFLHWFYNVFMVTSQRVVDIDYSDVVVHNIAVTDLSHVQDVNYSQSGFIPTFFNFGNLFVQTAGTETNFEALSIPKPREATHIIGDLIGKDRSKH